SEQARRIQLRPSICVFARESERAAPEFDHAADVEPVGGIARCSLGERAVKKYPAALHKPIHVLQRLLSAADHSKRFRDSCERVVPLFALAINLAERQFDPAQIESRARASKSLDRAEQNAFCGLELSLCAIDPSKQPLAASGQ